MAYARGRIPVYWIINLVDHQVEVLADADLWADRRNLYNA
jgi:hypothetical protein